MSTGKSFGGFLRSKRKALGLTLREFCRRNGFDPANVSRVERGLAPPPQGTQILESYAKALKLESGTGAWNTFLELAAAETGRIPADVLEDQQSAQKLPSLFRQLRARGQGHSGWVRARHLEAWADSLDARGTLPQLIRRLIRATGKEITKPIEFPAYEQGQRPGWDGIVEAGAGDEFVPEGTSGWELGVDKNHQKKAEEDFTKRTKDPLGLDRKKTTFVFVTPRKWQKKGEWCRAKIALGAWKEVRVYDSASLEEWLEQAPAVDAWLAGLLGQKPAGLISLDEYWANLQALTDPSLTPEVFLASREAQVKELSGWLDGPPGAMTIEARSPAEAIDFVAAYGRDPSRADEFAARALIVESRDAWRAVAASSDSGLLLIPHPSLQVEPEIVAEAARHGHRVLLSCSQAPREQVATLRLPRAYRYDLEKALESSGIDREKAGRYAREAGGSLTVLKRLLGGYPGTTQPEWSRSPDAAALVPILLAGSWDESSEGDRLSVERLAGQPYSTVAAVAERWLKAPDSPLARAGSRWNLASRDDSWFLLAPAVTPNDLGRFEEVVLEVLGEDDPSYELPPRERWTASFQKKAPKHSAALRNGLAETLALLGARPERLPDSHGLCGRVEQIVRKLLDRQDWRRWASLSHQLPLLAEAGPEAFVEAAERDLKRSGPAVVKLFEQEGDMLLASNPHTGLLWALEVLAWYATLLPKVSLILATLDEMSPPAKSGNSPSRSLLEIFMPWFPQTTAPVGERVAVLRKVAQNRPHAGWRLLVGLLPEQMPMATHIHRPSWRDWALAWSSGVTNAAYWHQVEAFARLLVEQLGDDIVRWKALIDRFENLPGPVQKEFLDRLNAFAERNLDDETRREVSDALRDKVSWHRKFSYTDWAIPAEILSELEKLQRRFEPTDPVRRIAWLFGPHWKVLEKLEDKEERVGELRRSSLRNLLDQAGWQGVLRLVEAVESPEEVGAVFAETGAAESEANILPALLISAGEKAARFARGYIGGCFRKEGWDWVNRLKMDEWSVEEVARGLVVLPFERRTWEFAAGKGTEVATWYWNNTPPFTRGEDGDEASYAVTMFLKNQRASAAFHVLRMALHQKSTVEPSLLMDALETWIKSEAKAGSPDRIHGVKYDIHLLFQELQKGVEQMDQRVDLDRLAKLEWAYLGLLDGYPASPNTLHGLLRDDPAFFVEVLGLAFRSKNEPMEGEMTLTEEKKRRSQNAYRLLRSWQNVPGSRDGQAVDEKTLLGWIQKAHSLAEERGLLEMCDSRIGEVFAYAPEEADGSWPCLAVRDALEEIGTDDVFQGWIVGIFNKRGMYWKSPREGGAQERALAEKYRGFAEASKVDWPMTAAALRRVALGYEENARREEAEAMLD